MTGQNLRHWSALSRTDPSHTKPFQRAGGFRGTAIKPIWSTRQMTEHFGPCGVGWGMDKPEFTTMPVGDEILVYCTTALWYAEPQHCDDDAKRYVYGVGGDKVAVKRKDGGVIADDEAFKKAYTDALSNAMKQIGVGADVHMGLFDDSKYVNELRQEFAAEAKEHTNGTGARPSAPSAPSASSAPLLETAQSAKESAAQFVEREAREILTGIRARDTIDKLDQFMDASMDRRHKLPQVTQQYLSKTYMQRREAMIAAS